MEKYRLRYAPSPTGFLHIGGARTALFNYLYAKHYNGKFIVRIDDTDTKRNVEGGEESQLKFLRWLGIEIDETTDTKPKGKYAPYRQSEKFKIYYKYLEKLLKTKDAYRCFCSEAEITTEREKQKKQGQWNFMHQCPYKKSTSKEVKDLMNQKKEFSIRIAIPENKTVTWKDIIRGEITINSNEIGDWVAWRKNDTTYL